jgi:hypothetical protein
MNRARQWLNKDGMMEGDFFRHFVVEGTRGEHHVLSPGTKCSLSKTVNIVGVAHPVGAHFAELAVPAWHDLLTYGVVANLEAVQFSGAVSKSHDFADELVPWRDWSLTVTYAVFVAPEQCSACVAFDVTRTDTGAGYPNQDLARARFRNRTLLKPIVVGAVSHNSRHRFRQFIH